MSFFRKIGVTFDTRPADFVKFDAFDVKFCIFVIYFCSDTDRKAGTTMLRIALCDDETSARDALRFQLEKILLDGNEGNRI